MKDGAEQFLIRCCPRTRAWSARSTTRSSSIRPTFTNNRDQLVDALKDLDFGYPTRLYDAVDAEHGRSCSGVDGRKVVLVFTDGDDNVEQAGLRRRASIARARRSDDLLGRPRERLLQRRSSRCAASPDRGLRKLSEETGGGFFVLKKTDELGPTFTRVAQELHSQYVLGFSPETLDGKIHKLEVRVKKPGMTARARKSYVAEPSDGHGHGEVTFVWQLNFSRRGLRLTL